MNALPTKGQPDTDPIYPIDGTGSLRRCHWYGAMFMSQKRNLAMRQAMRRTRRGAEGDGWRTHLDSCRGWVEVSTGRPPPPVSPADSNRIAGCCLSGSCGWRNRLRESGPGVGSRAR
jgi:hypothetical protein